MSEVLKRSTSGLVYVLLIVCALYFGGVSTGILLLFFSIASFSELRLGMKKSFGIRLLALDYILFLPFIFYALGETFFAWSPLHRAMVHFATYAVFLFRFMLLFSQKEKAARDFILVLFSYGYAVVPFLFVFTHLCTPFRAGEGTQLLLVVFLFLWSSDTFAYLTGKQWGKHKIVPSLSPKKSYEGLIGGMLCTVIIAFLLPYFLPYETDYPLVVLAVLVSLVGFLGDIFQSSMKRYTGVKDSGKIMPGHGGLLDRLDSFIIAAPIAVLFSEIYL